MLRDRASDTSADCRQIANECWRSPCRRASCFSDETRHERGLPAEDQAAGIIRFEGNHELVLEVDMLGEERAATTYQLTGPEGIIRVDAHSAALLGGDQKGWQELELTPQPTPLEELLAWMEGGPEHRNSGRTAMLTEEIMMAIYESARLRQYIEPPFDKLTSPLLEMVADGTLAVNEPAFAAATRNPPARLHRGVAAH